LAWAKAGTTTLGTAGDNISAASLPDNKSYMVLSHGLASCSIQGQYRLNGDTGTNYAYRRSVDGGADGTSTSIAQIYLGMSCASNDQFSVAYFFNISTEEKLMMSNGVKQNTAGAANAPSRGEAVGKHAQTTNPIDEITLYNDGSGDYDTSSNLSVLGSDLTPAAGTSATISDGAIFYETDNNKSYVLYNGSWTEL
jgi:hypothetical protein|tara:strand:- start:201 stop:788 length:588 start_codon:yes stop_codon:yes gene_type:complete